MEGDEEEGSRSHKGARWELSEWLRTPPGWSYKDMCPRCISAEDFKAAKSEGVIPGMGTEVFWWYKIEYWENKTKLKNKWEFVTQ